MIEHILSKLPPAVRDSIYSLHDIGLPDLAWPLEEIDGVLRAIKDKDFAILGGDIYEEQDGRVRPTSDSWYVNRQSNESFEDYTRRSWQRAWEYTLTFPRAAGRTRYVSLVMSDDPTAGIV